MVLIRDTQLDCVPEDKIEPFQFRVHFVLQTFSLSIPVFNLNSYASISIKDMMF
jgi:hypothetical protein